MTQFSRRKFLRTSIVGGASITTAALAHAAPAGIYKAGTYSSKAAGIGALVGVILMILYYILIAVVGVGFAAMGF